MTRPKPTAVLLAGAVALIAGLASSLARAQPKPADRLPVAFSPDGKLALAGCADGRVRVWDLASRKLVRALVRHTIKICAVAVVPDGSLALSAAEDGTVQIYRLATGELAAEALVANELEPLTALAVAADGKRFLVASQNRAVHMFELIPTEDRRTGEQRLLTKLVRTFRRPAGAMGAVAFSPDGTRVLAGGSERVLVFWNAETKEELGAAAAHKDLITAVAFAPNGKQFLSASLDGTLKLWDAAKGAIHHALDAHEGGVTAAVFSRDSAQVLTGGKNGWMKLWDAESGKFLKAIKGPAAVLGLALSPDGKWIVTGTADRTVRLWDATAGKEVAKLPLE